MSTAFDKFERFGKKVYNGQDVLKNHFLKTWPVHRTDNPEDETQALQYKDQADWVWIIHEDLDLLDTFPLYVQPSAKGKVQVFPYVYKSSHRIKTYEWCKLCPTRFTTELREKHDHIAGVYDVYQGKSQFDLFFIGDEQSTQYKKLLDRFPHAQCVDAIDTAQALSETDMLWIVPDDIDVTPIFKFSYQPDDWSQKYAHMFRNGDSQDGIVLLPKYYELTDKEVDHRFYINKKEVKILASNPVPYDRPIINSYDDYLHALENSKTEMFWYVPNDVEVDDDFDFSLYFDHHVKFDRNINHVFLNNKSYDGIALFSKNSKVSKKEFEHRFYANKKEHEVVASRPKKFDQFVVNNYDDYKLALERSSTEMFWAVPDDVVVKSDFEFDLYFDHHNRYDRNITHVFLNNDMYDGIALLSKSVSLSEKEINNRFFVKKKEHNIVASFPKSYDIFEIDCYQDYLDAVENTTTDLFWMSSKNLNILDYDVIEDFYISYHSVIDRNQHHSFLHAANNDTFRTGLYLVNKNKKLTKKEVEHRFIAKRKEWDIVLSTAVSYDVFNVETYEDYLYALDNTKTEMFYATSPNISIDFDFNQYFEHSNEYDRKINHAFIHQVNGKDLYNGLWLMSVHSPVSQKEIEHKHLLERKEWDIVASKPVIYDEFVIETYQDYLHALENSKTEMFWGVTNNVDFYSGMVKDIYFSHDNTYDRNINHAFVHRVDNEDFYNGIFLFSKNCIVTEKEIEYRHLVNVKHWDIVASGPKQYDKFIIETYEDYKIALEKSTTELFWADSENIDTSSFDFSSIYFTHDNIYDRTHNHAFAHGVDGNILYNGLFLLSKHSPITPKELEYRHIVNVKEWLTIASKPITYPLYIVDSFEDYEMAFYNNGPEMFWMSSANIDTSDFDFSSVYFSHDNQYDRKINHAFKHVVDGKEYYNGLFLISRHCPISKKEVEHRFLVNRKEWDIVASGPKKYEVYTVDSWQDYKFAMDTCETEMFWMTSKNIDTSDFDFNVYFTHDNVYDRNINHAFIHEVKDEKLYNGLFLMSINKPVTEKEIQYRHIAECKYWDIVASKPKTYDKFIVESYDDYLEALDNSTTEMFWATTRNVDDSDFDYSLYFSHDNVFDRNMNHAFLHCDDKYNGIFLLSVNKPITSKEIEYRHIVDVKQWKSPCTKAKQYDSFIIDTYDDYVEAFSKTQTEMFWGLSSYTELCAPLDIYFTHDNEYDRNTNHQFLHKGNQTSYNGVILYSKHSPVTEKEVEHKHIVKRKEWDIVLSESKQYDIFNIDTYEDYLHALDNTKTELFWANTHNINTKNFDFDIVFDWNNEYDRKTNHAFIHNVDGKKMHNGLFLLSKHTTVTEKEILYRHIVNAKEWDIEASTKVVYDKFNIETYMDYVNALESSETEMFWGCSNNIDTSDFDFDVYFSHDNEYDRKQNHSFIHTVDGKKLRNGLFLFSKHRPVTQREIEYRHLLAGKEWNTIASKSVIYNKFTIDSYNDYLNALDTSKTEMFWGVPSDIDILDFEFDLYFSHDNKYDRETNHVFLNGEHYDGIVLFTKHNPVTRKEVENRFYANSKKWETVASKPKPYDIFNIETYDDYLEAIEDSSTEMFWATTPNIKIENTFNLSMYFSHHNSYDRSINHTFIHRVNNEDLHNGLFLLTKRSPLTQKEIEHRLVAKRKEWNIVASGPIKYEKFTIDTYSDYETALKKSKTEMFWMIPPEVNVADDFDFDMYFSHNQWFERNTNHVFKNGNAWDGISLVSKNVPITEREINMRFLTNKKQHEVVASYPTLYDIVFISKDEEHANENFENLLQKFPERIIHRVHGVEGIHQAHIMAAQTAETDMIWIVDADAEIVDNFNFDYYVPAYDPDSRKTVHVWKSQNPINGLIYGYGAVKLLPRDLTLNMDTSKPDMTTSISPLFKTVNRVSNITKFNTDEFSTWRSAFRECVKLSARAIDGQLDEETEFRLNAWCTRGKDKLFGDAAISGAIHGKKYGENNRGNLEALRKINDFDWLRQQFDNFKNSL